MEEGGNMEFIFEFFKYQTLIAIDLISIVFGWLFSQSIVWYIVLIVVLVFLLGKITSHLKNR